MAVMGYDVLAESMGGTDAHYFSVARQYGFLLGAGDSGGIITRGQFAKMIYNTFGIGVVKTSAVLGNSSRYSVSSDETSLSFHGLRRGEGVVTASDVSSIYYSASAMPRGRVTVGNDSFFEGSSGAGFLLGYNIEFFYEYEDRNDGYIRYATPYRNMEKRLDLEREDIEISGGSVYINVGRNRSWVNISPRSCMIYNGKAVEYDPARLTSGDAEILFVSNTNSGNYEMIFINHYSNGVVSSVNAANGCIYTEGQSIAGGCVDLKDQNVRKSYIYRGNTLISVGDIKTGDVISVAASEDFEYFLILVSDKRARGRLTEFSLSEDRYFIVNGEKYKSAWDFRDSVSLSKSKEVTLLLNFQGRIVDFIAAPAKNYAFVIGAQKNFGLSGGGQVKLLLANGTAQIFDLAPRVNIDNNVLVRAEVLADTLEIELDAVNTVRIIKTGKTRAPELA